MQLDLKTGGVALYWPLEWIQTGKLWLAEKATTYSFKCFNNISIFSDALTSFDR